LKWSQDVRNCRIQGKRFWHERCRKYLITHWEDQQIVTGNRRNNSWVKFLRGWLDTWSSPVALEREISHVQLEMKRGDGRFIDMAERTWISSHLCPLSILWKMRPSNLTWQDNRGRDRIIKLRKEKNRSVAFSNPEVRSLQRAILCKFILLPHFFLNLI
jgi:hypothetical protein